MLLSSWKRPISPCGGHHAEPQGPSSEREERGRGRGRRGGWLGQAARASPQRRRPRSQDKYLGCASPEPSRGRTAPVVSSGPVGERKKRDICYVWGPPLAHLHPPGGREFCNCLPSGGLCAVRGHLGWLWLAATPCRVQAVLGPHGQPGCGPRGWEGWWVRCWERCPPAPTHQWCRAQLLGFITRIYNYYFPPPSYTLRNSGLPPLKTTNLTSLCLAHVHVGAK